MESRVYTAQEMREAVDAVDQVSVNNDGEYFYEKQEKFNPDIVRDMLRQAAEILERSEEVLHDLNRDISAMNGYQLNIDAREFVEKIVYILRGDAGKEEK